ncbi:MAG TPA: hypothetical protein DCY79_06765, partial [Planctomycetaceae bacterium]|nr:hypothetical protein [Planctomycetaceae bacterium]
DFNRDIRPILSENCFQCHGPDAAKRKAGLRLDTREGATQANDGSVAIDSANLAKSELLARIVSTDPDSQMPPPESNSKLAPEQIALLQRWVSEGAKYDQHWAFKQPVRHALPALSAEGRAWARNAVDHFVSARQAEVGLSPSPEAERATLLRRVSLDLTGLPPTPGQLAAFMADTEPRAYERAVDRLLQSPRYGERWGRHWLDAARYADSDGYSHDAARSIWPYRDWVIEAFNRDLPFDQFVVEQLAGDMLPDASLAQRVATGFHRNTQINTEGGVDREQFRIDSIYDRIATTGEVMFGLTFGCAQCHDHKYDPYTMQDFYSLVAFFADLDESQHFKVGTNSLPSKRPPEIKVLRPAARQRKAELARELGKLTEAKTDTAKTRIAEIQQELKAIDATARLSMISVAISPREIRLLPRGNWLDDSGPVMQPAVPEFLGKVSPQQARPTRLDLANWLTNPDDHGGLTARVFANRFWYLLMGTGLAPVLDDFGGQGQPPSHPKLLDNLAVEFYEQKWDVKGLFKTILMSRTYQQSSRVSPALRQRDPYNQLFARQSRYRLPAEMVRDNALAVSGLLTVEFGGASVKPYQPAGYYRHLNFPTRRYAHHDDQRQYRRGVYIHWQRQFLHPMLKSMDAPSREECTAQRPRSNTPVAALNLLNDPTFVEAARKFAERIMLEGGKSVTSRTDFAFRAAIARSPDDFEADAIKKIFAAHLATYRQDDAAAQALLSVGQAPRNMDLPTSELAAWTSVARVILNLNETITRN